MTMHGHARLDPLKADHAAGKHRARLYLRSVRREVCATDGCGTVLSADSVRFGTRYCASCRARLLRYNPAHDTGFDERLRALFATRPNEWLDPMVELCIAPQHRKYVKDRLRRHMRALLPGLEAKRCGLWRWRPRSKVKLRMRRR